MEGNVFDRGDAHSSCSRRRRIRVATGDALPEECPSARWIVRCSRKSIGSRSHRDDGRRTLLNDENFRPKEEGGTFAGRGGRGCTVGDKSAVVVATHPPILAEAQNIAVESIISLLKTISIKNHCRHRSPLRLAQQSQRLMAGCIMERAGDEQQNHLLLVLRWRHCSVTRVLGAV